MAAPRGNLQKALCQYTKETLTDINTLKEFSERLPAWINARKTELRKVTDIKKRSKKREVQEKELAAVLKVTLRGLKKLDCFLDAVERLAVTSLHVFNEENRVLPQDISPDTVQVGINAARWVFPLLLQFKRDAKAFFLPKLQNVEVLEYQLDKYIQTTQEICDKLEESSFSEFCLRMNMETVVDLGVDLSEDDIQRMLCHINQLNEIRMDQDFRMMFLFKEELCRRFISDFDERKPRMLQFLNDMEETCVQLDRMNKGSKISSVAGSSVGAVGGILTIIGLALIPVTAGASLALTMTGAGLGITSGVNSAVTTVTKIGVNRRYQKKANEAFQSFMEDVQSLQDCLEEVSRQTVTNMEASKKDMAMGVGKVLWKVPGVGKGIKSVADDASVMKMLKSNKQIAGAGKVVSDVPDAGQAAVKGSLALTKSARASLIGLNAFFIGMDIFFICKDSISLAKGSETEVSQLIRARAALWRSEMDSWKKIRDSLRQGLRTSEKKQDILERPFYPQK